MRSSTQFLSIAWQQNWMARQPALLGKGLQGADMWQVPAHTLA